GAQGAPPRPGGQGDARAVARRAARPNRRARLDDRRADPRRAVPRPLAGPALFHRGVLLRPAHDDRRGLRALAGVEMDVAAMTDADFLLSFALPGGGGFLIGAVAGLCYFAS